MEVRESRASAFLADLPSGARTLITSRHQPLSLPAYPIDVPPLDRTEAEALANLEAALQHVDPTITERFLDQIVTVSEHVPLAIKWIIACSKNADHLVQLLEEHRRGKPALANLCEFCFEFEYNLLTPTAQRALCLFPLFQRAPTLRELTVAADVRDDVMQSALDQLIAFSLVIREHTQTRDEEVFRTLRLTLSFATAKLRGWGDLDKQAKRRLKAQFGPTLPLLLKAAEEMIERGATGVARRYLDEEILERDPSNARAFYLRGLTFEQEFDYSSALQDFQRALRSVGTDPPLLSDAVLHILSVIRSDPRPKEDKIPGLARAYEVSNDPRLALELANLFTLLEKMDDARQYYQKVFRTYIPAQQTAWEEAFVFGDN